MSQGERRGLEEELIRILEPLITNVVRAEVARAQLQWRWRSVKQAAGLLDLSEAAIHTRCSRGRLPFIKLDGRVYIDMVELERQLLQCAPD